MVLVSSRPLRSLGLDIGRSKGDPNIQTMFESYHILCIDFKKMPLDHICALSELRDPLTYVNMFAPALQFMQVVAPCPI